MTSLDRFENFENGSHITNLSKTLAADLISSEKDLRPYWNLSCEGMSQKLLWLTETGSVGSDLNSFNELQTSTIAESWFSTTLRSPLKQSLLQTCFPSFMCSPVAFTASENTVVRSEKIRIYPKKESLARMKQYLGLTRHWYNTAIEYLQQPGTEASLSALRKLQDTEQQPEWAFDSPQRIREHALADAAAAVKAAKKKCEQTGQYQQVSFRSKKDTTQRFGFDAKSLKADFIFGKKADRAFFQTTEPLEANLEGTEVVYENGRWFLILPQTRKLKQPENQRLPVCALDPGVRTFQSFYGMGVYGKLGEGDFAHIYRLCQHLDRLISTLSQTRGRGQSLRRLGMRKAIKRLKWQIRDKVDEAHKKVAHFLVTRFDVILLPTFETSEMVSKLRSKTARQMLSWAHYRFKMVLKSKAEEYSAVVVDVCEAYTSKTCSYCGHVHQIGSKKVLRCRCGAEVDRDLNGARGILLRALSATTYSKDFFEVALASVGNNG